MSIEVKITKSGETLGCISEDLKDTSSMIALLDSLRAAKTSTNSFITDIVELDKKSAGKPEAELTECNNDDGADQE